MSIGHIPGVSAARWRDARNDIQGRWPKLLVEMDLNFWADPKSCGTWRRAANTCYIFRFFLGRGGGGRRAVAGDEIAQRLAWPPVAPRQRRGALLHVPPPP